VKNKSTKPVINTPNFHRPIWSHFPQKSCLSEPNIAVLKVLRTVMRRMNRFHILLMTGCFIGLYEIVLGEFFASHHFKETSALLLFSFIYTVALAQIHTVLRCLDMDTHTHTHTQMQVLQCHASFVCFALWGSVAVVKSRNVGNRTHTHTHTHIFTHCEGVSVAFDLRYSPGHDLCSLYLKVLSQSGFQHYSWRELRLLSFRHDNKTTQQTERTYAHSSRRSPRR